MKIVTAGATPLPIAALSPAALPPGPDPLHPFDRPEHQPDWPKRVGPKAERRALRRRRARFSIRFGLEAPSRTGLTEDLSPAGMFLSTSNVHPPGTRLQLRLEVAPGEQVDLEALVVWVSRIPPGLNPPDPRGGMGLRFLGIRSGRDAFRRYLVSSA